jgi:hypothetical protein
MHIAPLFVGLKPLLLIFGIWFLIVGHVTLGKLFSGGTDKQASQKTRAQAGQLVLLALVLGALGLRLLAKRRSAAESGSSEETFRQVKPKPEAAAPGEPVPAPAPGHWVTTYKMGENAYDESFPIETASREYLGECGVGISELLGAPDKVTAFEVWLFDKSDIRTVTKVLLSEYAFRDDALRAKLAAKGEVMLAEVGTPLVLDTSNLQIQAKVTELEYGTGDQQPNSVFARLTIELMLATKEEASEPEVVQ